MAGIDVAVYRTDTLEFAYPSNWVCEAEDHADGTSILLQSNDVTYCIVGIYDESLEPAFLIDQAMDGLRDEHPGLEFEETPVGQADAKVGALSVEAIFFSLDVLTYCWFRAWRIAGKSVLVMVQTIEPESKKSKAVFQAICHSMRKTA